LAALRTAAHGGYCCKSRKSNNPKNFAKVDLGPSLPLRRFTAPLPRFVIDFGRNDVVPHVAAHKTLRRVFENTSINNPDMPVFANGELAEAVAAASEGWAGKVFYVEGFDRETTDFIMQTALDAGASLGEMDVPYFAVAVSTAKNLFGWWQGRIPLADLPFSVVLDGAVKGGLAAAGGISGNVLGLLLLGPAGALVFGVGGAGALLGSAWTRQQVTRLISNDWLKSLDETTDRLQSALIGANQTKIRLLMEKRAQIVEQDHEQEAWFLAVFPMRLSHWLSTSTNLRMK
jgi:hypothetical protein